MIGILPTDFVFLGASAISGRSNNKKYKGNKQVKLGSSANEL
jgi:hypothetical protein